MQKTLANVSILLVMAGLTQALGAPDVVKKEFEAKPGGKLVVQVDRGDIQVKSGDIDKVQITVERELRGAGAEEQERLLKGHQLQFSADNGEVLVKASRPGAKRFSFRDPFNKLRVRYSIIVPSRFDADVHTSGGNIAIASLEGKVNADTSGGNLDLASINGPVSARTSGGNVLVKDSRGDTDLHTSGGNIQAGSIAGNLVAKTSGGDIRVDKISGKVEARTSGGNIQLAEVGSTIVAQTSGGNISARLGAAPEGNCTLRTSGGNVELILPADIALTVDAETSGGSVSSAFPAEINKARTKLQSKINGGGPTVALSTSGGDVRVSKK